MNPDVFITIAFVGIAVMVVLVPLAFVIPQARREAVRVRRREAKQQSQKIAPSASAPTSTANAKHGPVAH